MTKYTKYSVKLKDLNLSHHFMIRCVSSRFYLSSNQYENLMDYTFLRIGKTILEKYPWWYTKMREGYSYYYNEEINMVLVVGDEEDVVVTCLKLLGTDYSNHG